ncbi:MAG: Asp/Glu/hydantoin racemase [Pseudomonas sp.]|nr:Asp/Glu/hydantoin racemase [Pseudomonas sp.]
MRTMRIGFVHTVGFLVENFRERMRTQLPDVDCFHSLNESLLQDLLRGAPQAEVYRRVVEQIMLVADAQPDLIVVTCSSTSPAVDIARGLVSVPVLKIDDAMASLAVRSGQRIGLLCTATSTVEPSSALLRAHAKQQGVEVSIEVLLQAEAYKALMAGDRAAHDEIIEAAAKAMLGKVDVLVLAQASLAHLQEQIAASLPIPVLASPQLLMDDIARRVAEFNAGHRA